MKRTALAALGGALSATLVMGALVLVTPAGARSAGDAPSMQDGRWRFGGPARHGALRMGLTTAAEAIGIEPAELREALSDGETSLADVASDNGVDPQVVIDALVAERSAMIDRAVEDGRINEQMGERLKATLTERITERVNTAGFRCGPKAGATGDAAELSA